MSLTLDKILEVKSLKVHEAKEENKRLKKKKKKKQLNLALHVINCIPENQLNELADQQLQAIKKEMGLF